MFRPNSRALLSGVVQLVALSPPTVIVARDKFKLRIHGSTLEDVANLQNGLAFSDKLLRETTRLVKRILRARSRAHRYFGKTNAARPKFWPSFSMSKWRLRSNPIGWPVRRLRPMAYATDKEVEDFLRADAEVLKLKEPVAAAKIFDFSLQREVNQELGIK